MGLIEAGPTAVRVIYLLARGLPFGWSSWAGAALLPAEFAATAFVDGAVFVFVHLGIGALFGGLWLAERAGSRWNRLPARDERRDERRISRRGGPGRGSASPVEW
jgi:hypothetical protein